MLFENFAGTPLHYSAFAGIEDQVRRIISQGCDVNSIDKCGWKALHYALISPHRSQQIIDLLLSKGTSIDIHDAVLIGDIFAIKHILTHDPSLVDLEAEGDPFFPDFKGLTPLHFAAIYGLPEPAACLISAGANVNANSNEIGTPLHYASEYQHNEVVSILLSSNASPDAIDQDYFTPLHKAAMKGSLIICKSLILYGADINTRDRFGETPLHIAINRGYREVAKYLIEAGADIHAQVRPTNISDETMQNLAGVLYRTPLHYALERLEKQIARELIIAGAHIHIRDFMGRTPISLAKCPFERMELIFYKMLADIKFLFHGLPRHKNNAH